MRIIFIAAAMAACLVTPAAAQGKRGQHEDKKTESTGPKIDDKAYKAALERIPEPKEKYDPWGGVAPAPAAGKKTR
jgi:hypothetical protein